MNRTSHKYADGGMTGPKPIHYLYPRSCNVVPRELTRCFPLVPICSSSTLGQPRHALGERDLRAV